MNKWIILLCLCACFGQSAPVFAQDAQGPLVEADDWQMTFDVIKSRLKILMEENNQLTTEYQTLLTQAQSLQKSIEEKNAKNESIRQFLRERNGRTDQQMKIVELNGQINDRKSQLIALQAEGNAIKKETAGWQRKVELKKLKIADMELHQNMPVIASPEQPSGDPELDALRKDLETQKAQEVALESELSVTRNYGQVLSSGASAGEVEIKSLQQKLDFLRQQKQAALQKISSTPSADVDKNRYYVMAQQKAELESKIKSFETRINVLKDPASFATAWPVQKKRLIRDIVQEDARNGQMRSKISTLREDIVLLRDQIARLEKRVNFSQGKGKIQPPMSLSGR